jgi:hypothetical protein
MIIDVQCDKNYKCSWDGKKSDPAKVDTGILAELLRKHVSNNTIVITEAFVDEYNRAVHNNHHRMSYKSAKFLESSIKAHCAVRRDL